MYNSIFVIKQSLYRWKGWWNISANRKKIPCRSTLLAWVHVTTNVFFLINLFLSIYTLCNHKITNKLIDYLNEYFSFGPMQFDFFYIISFWCTLKMRTKLNDYQHECMLHNFLISSHRSKILHTNIYFFNIIF